VDSLLVDVVEEAKIESYISEDEPGVCYMKSLLNLN